MTGESNTLLAETSRDGNVPDGTPTRVVFSVMRAARGWFKHKPSMQLAAICGCDVKTAERLFRGDRAPNGEAVIAMLRSEVGVRLVEEATRDLSPKEFKRFWREMGLAALRANLREREEEMAR